MIQMDHSWVSRYPEDSKSAYCRDLDVSVKCNTIHRSYYETHLKRLTIKKGIKKICYIHTMACFSVIKNEVTLFAEIWI